MSDKAAFRGIYYIDVVAVLLIVVIFLGRLVTRDSPASPPVARDVFGAWVPVLAVALLAACRRRAHAQATPWVVHAFGALALTAVAAIFWRLSIMAFLAAIGSSVLLLLVGLVLRTRQVLESVCRPDLFALILSIGGVCIGVALTETVLRLAPGLFNEEIQRMLEAHPANYGVAHPYIGYLHRPNNTIVLSGRDFHAVHHVDALGFRNTWPWPDRAEIVAVGDSLTFGFGVADDQTWPYLLSRSAPDVRVINLGMIGAGPQQYLRVLETFGVQLRPKLVVVGLFARNDFSDADAFDRWLRSGLGGNFAVWRDFGGPEPVKLSLRHPRYTLKQLVRLRVVPAIRSSYLYTLLHGFRGGLDGEAPAFRIFHFADGRRLQLLEGEYRWATAGAQPGRREFRLVLESLRQIHSVGERHGARVLVVLQPGKEEVYLPLLGPTPTDPTGALRAALDRVGIEYLDLTPGFAARAAAGEQLFFEVDGHPNQAGYALTAELVLAHIRQNLGHYGLADDGTRHTRIRDVRK